MNKYFLLGILFSFFFTVKADHHTEGLTQKWLLESIRYEGDDTSKGNLKPIAEGDYMTLTSDGKFVYELTDVPLKSEGTWEIEGDILTYHYSLPNDTLRSFRINISDSALVLKENGVNFSYCLNKARAIVEPVVAVATTTKHEGDPFYIRFLRGLLGIAVVFMIAFFFSENKMAISWKVVGIGLGMQVTLAFLILNPLDIWALDFFSKFFDGLGKTFVKILDFSKEGTKFLFSSFLDIEKHGFLFAFQVLPTIIFFSALTSVLFYLGIIQKIVYVFAIALTKALKLSGAESLSVAGNIFLGQTESPLMIKAYLEKMSRSEILLVMTGGMATLAGGVLAAYIAFLGGDDPVERLTYAKHLLAASFMAAPGAVIISKIIVPQSEKIESDVEITKEKIGSNVLDSISNGTVEGLKLAVNVASMLLVFIAFIAMFNFMLVKVGSMTGLNSWITDISNAQYNEFSLQFILGYVFAPLMWVLGVCTEDMTLVGRLIGEKVIMTEFIGYISLKDLKEAGAFTETKSIIMATYMLCGFANFASIGIQIGGIGSLAPGKRKLLSEFGLKALLAGTLASLLSATIIGMILG